MQRAPISSRQYPREMRPSPSSRRPAKPELMTVQQAAEVLCVSVRTVQRYVVKGAIRRAWKDGKRGVVADDVRELKVNTGPNPNLGVGLVAPRPIDFALLEQRLFGVERDMQVVTTILDNSGKGLELDNDAAVSLLRSAQYFANHGWPDGSETEWAEIFLRMRCVDVRKIEKAVGRELGWFSFYRLATDMARAAIGSDDSLYRLLRVACDHLERIGVECIEDHRGKGDVKRRLRELAGIGRNATRRARERREATKDDGATASTRLENTLDRNLQLRRALSAFVATHRDRTTPC